MNVRTRLVGVARRHLLARRHLVITLGVAVLLFALTGGAIALAAVRTAAPAPWPSAAPKVMLYVDTEAAAAEGVYADCQQGSVFTVGNSVLFRVAGEYGDVALTPSNVSVFEVNIPGVKAPLPLAWGAHTFGVKKGFAPPEYWTVAWQVPTKYPLGVVNFTVTVISKTAKQFSLVWSQIPISSSDLTIATTQ